MNTSNFGGTMGFNEGGKCYGRFIPNKDEPEVVVTLRGSWTPTLITLSGAGIKMAFTPTADNVKPALAGSVTLTDTGETFKALAWAPKTPGAVGYGISADEWTETPPETITPF